MDMKNYYEMSQKQQFQYLKKLVNENMKYFSDDTLQKLVKKELSFIKKFNKALDFLLALNLSETLCQCEQFDNKFFEKLGFSVVFHILDVPIRKIPRSLDLLTLEKNVSKFSFSMSEFLEEKQNLDEQYPF